MSKFVPVVGQYYWLYIYDAWCVGRYVGKDKEYSPGWFIAGFNAVTYTHEIERIHPVQLQPPEESTSDDTGQDYIDFEEVKNS